jgi:acyl carrier protein phosphodiesterase
MNYLAHFYLSNYDKDLIIGNYIADDVKGKSYLNYPLEIQKGILLHRKIDDFTDNHETVLNSKNIIRHHQNKYTPVVMDVFYDYFLAKDWEDHSNDNLKDFTEHVYKILFQNIKHLPLKSQMRLPFMAKSNWLYNYRKIEGIDKALSGLSKRSNYTNNMSEAHYILKEKEYDLQQDFNLFFPELKAFVNGEIKKRG